MKVEPITIRQITKNQFNIFMLFTRHPAVQNFARELEYHSNDDNSILGVVLLDLYDRDFSYVLLVRDENRQFREFDTKVSFSSKAEAVDMLSNSMKWHTAQNLKSVVHNLPERGMDLFNIVVNQEKIHPYFTRLNEDTQFIPSKRAIIEIANHLSDIDGNFIEQFQSLNGFDARLWEIYLFASLTEQEFLINRKYERPDFIIQKYDVEIGVEAVTLGRDKNNPPTYLPNEEKLTRPADILTKIQNEIPLRYGSTLFSKLSKKYWELSHLKDKPFLLAVADFHDDFSMTWSYISLVEYLYGQREELIVSEDGSAFAKTEKITHYTKPTGAKINSGFFFEPDCENISGVLFSTTGTIAKFTRMGIQAGFSSSKQKVLRVGDRYDHNSHSFTPISFSYMVDENCTETWSEGLNLFHNPNAKHPIDMDLFPNIAHHKLKGEQLISWAPDFHPFSSININTIVK
ncbi:MULTISPECIES: hypothetical protein [Hydrotalea]|uniref:hypothetical protein n=1 Tax=Hydrotalea TaxID=1004300 RepID=UPI000835DDCC|nr:MULTISPECIES: hypothetical protein [Hydrotalea]RTL53387.1 MAG: hypothetical protein EKK39_06075 [Sphingobacteriales bacterium]RWZ90874.1 MAG: hypothetical protein EO766_01590 [Hydrotalea sp. AMD]